MKRFPVLVYGHQKSIVIGCWVVAITATLLTNAEHQRDVALVLFGGLLFVSLLYGSRE